ACGVALLAVFSQVGRLELCRTHASIERHKVIGDDAPAQEQWHRVGDHSSTPFMKFTASLCTSCVAAQVIRSSSTPCFSLYRMMPGSNATLACPQGHCRSPWAG